MLYGYGGFEIALEPSYSGALGRAWLARGGVLVIANIRGGGEFGPAWHQAALKENRQNAFDDFIAIARRPRRGAASRSQSRSASAAAAMAGLLDRRRADAAPRTVWRGSGCRCRCSTCGAITSCWRARAGWPNTATPTCRRNGHTYRKYSPYQNVRKGVRYPPTLFVTSTRDDRVHPGARAQDVRAHAGAGARRLVLREYRRRPRRSVEQRAARADGSDRVHVSVETPRRQAVSSASMRAVEISQPGGPEVLRLTERPRPTRGRAKY